MLSTALLCGCHSYEPFAKTERTWILNEPAADNPIIVPLYEHEFLWAVLADVMNSHFEIARELPVRMYGNVLTEGRLDTKPKIGASLPELWHADSVGIGERFYNTLQTVQKRVTVRVVPRPDGYEIEVFVYKELEDNRRPLKSPLSAANLRYSDDADHFAKQVDVDASSAGWIMLGRDSALEHRLLKEIEYRLKNPPSIIRKSKEPIRG